jgi:GGDEF domain-containing protein
VISLKPYLFRDSNRDLESAYQRMIDLFLQAISLHAVEGDKADYERFCADMKGFAGRLTPAMSIADRFVVVGEILRALEDYNRQTSKYLRIQKAELQKMITMLTQTVIAVGASSETSIAQLQEIEKALEQTRVLEDIHAIKAQLGECLHGVRGEAQRQKAEGKSVLESLQQELAQSQELLGDSSVRASVDLATGLPDKAEADRRLREAAASSGAKFLLVAVVNRVQAVNARFGYAIGDQVLAAAGEHLHGALSAEDKLFRWQGPVLMAILSRTDTIDVVRNEVRRFVEKKLDKTFIIGSRAVLLPISISWAIFALTPPLDLLLRKIEIFTAAQISHDYV